MRLRTYGPRPVPFLFVLLQVRKACDKSFFFLLVTIRRITLTSIIISVQRPASYQKLRIDKRCLLGVPFVAVAKKVLHLQQYCV